MRCLLKLTFAAASLFMLDAAEASSWNYPSIGTDDSLYFFDADTVEKTRDKNVLVWVKQVNKVKADSDGTWSMASRWKINCIKKTIQKLSWSVYDIDGKFIKSNSTPGQEAGVVPDSIGESFLKIACDPSFPNDKSEKIYFKVKDVLLFTKKVVELENSRIDSAPQ